MVEDPVFTINPPAGAALLGQPVSRPKSLTRMRGEPNAFNSGLGRGGPKMANVGCSRKRTLRKQQAAGLVERLDCIDPFKFLTENLIDRFEKLIHRMRY